MASVTPSLISRARSLDVRQDQPYMPFPHSSRKEAVKFLRHNDYLLIHGGRIEWSASWGGFYLYEQSKSYPLLYGKSVEIGWDEVLKLIQANYPPPERQGKRFTIHDTIPCPSPLSVT